MVVSNGRSRRRSIAIQLRVTMVPSARSCHHRSVKDTYGVVWSPSATSSELPHGLTGIQLGHTKGIFCTGRELSCTTGGQTAVYMTGRRVACRCDR